MLPPSLQDLTGKIRKTQTYNFGIGGLADIWMGELSRESSKEIVAVKVVRDVSNKAAYFELLKTKLLREADLWSQLDHPYVTPFYGICFDLGPPSAPCLVCPYFKNGNLAKYIEINPNADRMKLVSQVASGLAYLHDHKVIHGDIKASNILVNDKHEACIADFGLSRILEASGFTTKSVGGTFRWMAHELLAPEGDSIPQVTAASDVWAFAMTVLEIITGKIPFFRLKHDAAVILSIVRGGRPKREEYPEANMIWFMLEQCWHEDPARRPSMKYISGSQVASG